MPHPELTLEKRIRAELCGLDARMCVYADDLRGTQIDLGAGEQFESASTIKIFVLGCLFSVNNDGCSAHLRVAAFLLFSLNCFTILMRSLILGNLRSFGEAPINHRQ